jgi:hypothetical protein
MNCQQSAKHALSIHLWKDLLFPIQHVHQQFTIPRPFPVSFGLILVIFVIVGVVVIAMFACKEEEGRHAMVSVLLQRVSTFISALTLIDCFKNGHYGRPWSQQ